MVSFMYVDWSGSCLGIIHIWKWPIFPANWTATIIAGISYILLLNGCPIPLYCNSPNIAIYPILQFTQYFNSLCVAKNIDMPIFNVSKPWLQMTVGDASSISTQVSICHTSHVTSSSLSFYPHNISQQRFPPLINCQQGARALSRKEFYWPISAVVRPYVGGIWEAIGWPILRRPDVVMYVGRVPEQQWGN